ncbi:MAG: PKD domain-containing protein [Candidatus Bathyarchaeia archaeon]
MRLRVSRVVITIFLLILSLFFILPVKADPSAILEVSLPEGTYVGYNNDPWLSECWLLNLTGESQTFILRIRNKSPAIRSYDTHIIVALNDAGYNNYENIIINGTQIPKSAFQYGTPRPYDLWTWPSGDVYPTWFEDTYINVGTVKRNAAVDLVVSVTFSDATDVRIHFDAYGSKKDPPPPSNAGQITHNSLSEDSTVLLYSGEPPLQPPFASFVYTPFYPESYETVTFNASESYDPDGFIVSYEWDFGDGNTTTVTDPTINHHYTTYGDYTVRLTVTDNDGLTGNTTKSIHVSQRPVAAFTFSPPDPIIHENITFDASASTPNGGDIMSYIWDFGDGNTTTVTDPTIIHAYEIFGNYTVTLNITDSEDHWDTESKIVEVTAAPIADFFWSPFYPQEGENVMFDASISAPDGGVIISYEWDFGDGNTTTVTDPTIIHAYSAMGDYTVTLNITNSMGRWDTESKTVTVVARRYFLEVKTDPDGVTSIPGEGWYDEGTNVTLMAPDFVDVSTGVRYRFSYWDVDGTSQGAGVTSITVHMDANHTATAHYILQYYLTVSSPYGTPSGEGWYDSGSTAYAALNTDTVDHGNDTRRVFTFWSGDATGTNYAQSDPINMNAPKTATANWKTQYYLTVSSPHGTPTPSEPGEWFDAGTSVTASVNSPVSGPSGTQYVCTGWTGTGSVPASGTTTSVTFTINEPSTITWNWKTQYYLTLTTTTGGVTDPSSSGWYDSGAIVSVMAIPDMYYLFDCWELDSANVGSANPYNVTMDTAHTLHAIFVRDTSTLTITVTAGGTTDPPPGSHVYPAGTNVTVTAYPDVDYILEYWEFDGVNVGFENPITVFLNPDHTLHAVFKYSPITHYLTVKTDPDGVTTIPGEGWYNEGDNVVLTAPEYVDVSTGVRYRFSYWDVDGTSQGAGVTSITVHMDANHTATAHYILQYYFTVSSPHGSPTPSSGWFDAGTSVTASVNSPVSGPSGTQYVCTGWTGTGSVPASGTTTSVTFTINEPSTITWNWKTQYYLTVKTSPSGIATISGQGWYDESTNVALTAPSVTSYKFLYWDIDGTSQGDGIKSISVNMNSPHTATAHYEWVPTVVGGSTASIKSPLVDSWLGLNVMLIAVVLILASWKKKHQRKN